MSYDLRFAVKVNIGKEERFVEIGCPELYTPTYNIGNMMRVAMDWDFEQSEFYRFSDIIDNIRNGADELSNNVEKYRKYEPPNKWGTVETAIKVLNGLWRDMQEISEEREIPMEYLWLAW